MEERIEEKVDIVLDGYAVQQDRLRRYVELLTSSLFRICLQDKLTISKHVGNGNKSKTPAPVKGGLVWTVIEDMKELASPQVEHELRIDAKVVRQSKAHACNGGDAETLLPRRMLIVCYELNQST
jgi:hypothetical protein